MAAETFTGPEAADQATHIVHDHWFAASRIHLDDSNLIVPFASRDVSSARAAVFDSELVIEGVRGWTVIDEARVEIYDFNRLSYDPDQGRITIEGNIPITIEVDLLRSDLALTISRP